MRLAPVAYTYRDGAVIVRTKLDGMPGPDLVIGPDNTLTLLQVTLAAIECEGDPEKIEAARGMCSMTLG